MPPYVGCIYRVILCFIAVSLLLGNAPSVNANGLPVLLIPSSAGDIHPDNATGIRLVKESLAFHIGEQLREASVLVSYELHNAGTEPRLVKMVFPSTHPLAAGAVRLNNTPLHITSGVVQTSEVPKPLAAEKIPLVDPINGQIYGRESARGQMALTYFEATFEPGKTSVLTVSYNHTAGRDARTRPNVVHNYFYVLKPAAYWESVGSIDIEVTVPVNARFASPMPFAGGQSSGAQVKTLTITGKPQSDLAFSVMSSEGLVFGPSLAVYQWLRVLPLMSAAFAGILLARFIPKKSGWATLIVVVLGGGMGFGFSFATSVLFAELAPIEVFRGFAMLISHVLVPMLGAVVAIVLGLVGLSRARTTVVRGSLK